MTGKDLLQARRRLKISRPTLAKRLHCSLLTIGNWEQERTPIPQAWQLRIATTFAMLLRSPLFVAQHVACPTCAGAGMLPAIYTKEGRLIPAPCLPPGGAMPEKYRYRTLQDQGLCGSCGKTPPDTPYKTCAICRQKVVESQARAKARAAARRRPRPR